MKKSNLSQEEIVILNNFATQVFRLEADKDYIAARALFGLNLGGQFLWTALQAVEKYIKGIFLFSEEPAPKGHEVLALFDTLVATVKDIKFDFSFLTRTFIMALQTFGDNRYLTHPRRKDAKDLILLDQTVWNLRRYCHYFRGGSIGGNGADADQCFRQQLLWIGSEKLHNNPHLYRIPGGYLEQVLGGSRKDPQRRFLIYKNFYFGAKKKQRVKHYRASTELVIPPHFNDPASFNFLRQYVYFPKEFIREFKKAHSLP